MRTLFHILILVSCALSLISCATFVEPKPETITFEQAMSEFGRGLVAAKQAESLAAKDLIASNGQDFRMGLLPSEAEVTFNIIASGKQDGKLYIDLSPIPTSPVVAGKAGAELGTSYSASRGNQITIKFFNIAFSKKTTTKEGAVILEEPTDPELLERVIAILDGQNSTPKGPVVFSPTHVTNN